MLHTLSFCRPLAFYYILLIGTLLMAPVFPHEIRSLQVFRRISLILLSSLNSATCQSQLVFYLITHILIWHFFQAVGRIHWNTEYQWKLSLRPLLFWDVTRLMSVTFEPSKSVSFRHCWSPVCSHLVKLVSRATLSSKTFPGSADVWSSARAWFNP